jgi:hypothetical protein
MNTNLTTESTSLLAASTRATAPARGRLVRTSAACLAAVALGCASARPNAGIDTGSSHPASAPRPVVSSLTIARIGTQIVRCDTGEGNLGGAGAAAPLTLPEVTSCTP